MDTDQKLKLLAEKLIHRLDYLGINRQEFAEYLNVNPSNVTKYLSGSHNFTLKTLIQIEEVLGISLLDLDKKSAYLSRRTCMPCRYIPGG